MTNVTKYLAILASYEKSCTKIEWLGYIYNKEIS